MPHRIDPQREAERRRVFRRMAWTFVYLPPLLALLVALAGGAVVAWLLPLPFAAYWVRWLFWAVALLLAGGALYLLQHWRRPAE